MWRLTFEDTACGRHWTWSASAQVVPAILNRRVWAHRLRTLLLLTRLRVLIGHCHPPLYGGADRLHDPHRRSSLVPRQPHLG
jgi:hypothetical protein